MKLLLDSHSLLWHANGDPQMSATATSLLVDPTNDLYLSMASIWEIAIKVGLKKLTLSAPLRHLHDAGDHRLWADGAGCNVRRLSGLRAASVSRQATP